MADVRIPCLFALLLLILPAAGDEGFVPLFNGKDLSGWRVVNTAPSTWSFSEEGYLVCSGKPVGEIRTKRMYQNYILEAEWRHLVPKGNAGIFVWADDITARGQPFIRGVEVQVLENAYGDTRSHTTHGDIFPIHGATMTPENGRGGSRAFPTESRSKPSPEWNHYRIECRDGEISLAVNGKVVTRGRDCVPRKGYICLESEGGLVHWRNIRIRELPDTPIDPSQVAVADRGYRCLYSGVDFAGWRGAEGWKSRDWELVNEARAAPLVTGESFSGNFGFIVDLKLGPDSGTPMLSIRGKSIAIQPSNPLLEKTGSYNRIEGAVTGDTLSLRINGKEAGTHPEIPGEGPIALEPDGPATWANPYVRKLP
ncbi:MAG: DUF1080 domain-containing protein [Verrucomicrobiae bacterium]|nr:DUF1080 domain-containing protein [Verrucomicrobiae bacterium]